MATMEQVEKLREKANVTYDEAKAALDASNGDILDALILLERQGKVNPPQNGGYYNSKNSDGSEKESEYHSTEKDSQSGAKFSQLVGRFFRWCGKIIGIGNVNTFEVSRKNSVIISVPITVLVLLLLFAFWFVIPLIIVGLFLGCRYIFRGPDIEKTGVNRVMDSAADAAENLKNEVKGNHDQK
jgi:hypothetical protein